MPTIQWFPGHMAKARREMSAALKQVDVVLELVDARLPSASRNPMLDELTQDKPRIVIMTRVDMADPARTEGWSTHFRSQGFTVVEVNAKQGAGVNQIVRAMEHAMEDKREKQRQRGIRPRPVRGMVVGIPNVGKSSLINRLANRAVAKTGDKPGVTKSQQWIRLGTAELLDTPGVLWPKFEDEHVAYTLAMSGAIKSDILDQLDVCTYFILWCGQNYPTLLMQKYQLDTVPTVQWVDSAQAWETVEPLLTAIARKRGFLGPGGVPNLERCAEAILREVQTGQLGRMTFEWPTP